MVELVSGVRLDNCKIEGSLRGIVKAILHVRVVDQVDALDLVLGTLFVDALVAHLVVVPCPTLAPFDMYIEVLIFHYDEMLGKMTHIFLVVGVD